MFPPVPHKVECADGLRPLGLDRARDGLEFGGAAADVRLSKMSFRGEFQASSCTSFFCRGVFVSRGR